MILTPRFKGGGGSLGQHEKPSVFGGHELDGGIVFAKTHQCFQQEIGHVYAQGRKTALTEYGENRFSCSLGRVLVKAEEEGQQLRVDGSVIRDFGVGKMGNDA